MAWPDGPPKHHKLHVFVRYVTADGRKLQTDGPIDVGPREKAADRFGVVTRPSRRHGRPPATTPQAARRCHGARPARLVAGSAVRFSLAQAFTPGGAEKRNYFLFLSAPFRAHLVTSEPTGSPRP